MGIFVSYSHEDAEKVQRIADALRRHSGHEVWFDNALRGGDKFFSVIAEEILKNEYFVFIVSDSSCHSDWCVRELQFAMSEGKKIMPIWLEEALPPPTVRLIIQNTHYISWYRCSDAQFDDEVKRAFSDESVWVRNHATAVDSDQEAVRREGEKYFLVEEDIRSIARLLRREKNGAYAECFRPENAVLLGLAYEMGIKTEQDLLKAEFYYKVGNHKGSQDARYLLAALLAEKDPEHIADHIREMAAAAENGSVFAMTYWGDAHYEGRYGLPVNKALAVSFWKKAADMGSPQSQYYMAYAHRWGEEVDKDPGLALMYALSATEHRFPRAFRIIGYLYKNGEFVREDKEKARQYFERALELGDRPAIIPLADILYEEEKYEEAMVLYRRGAKLADEGKIKSGYVYYVMGHCLYWGQGCEKDLEAAIHYYLKGAERNQKSAKKKAVSAINELADREERLRLLQRAASLDCPDAEYYLGKMMDKQEGSEESRSQAIAWWKQGAEKGTIGCILELLGKYATSFNPEGSKSAEDDLEKLFRSDHYEALRYFRMLFALPEEDSIEKNYNEKLASYYYYAYAVELDYDENPDMALALYYFQKALEINPDLPNNIVFFAVNGYLFPERWEVPMKKNVSHCIALLELAEKYLLKHSSESAGDSENIRSALSKMVEGYRHISLCYKKGEQVRKDRSKSLIYAQKAEECQRKHDELLRLKRQAQERSGHMAAE